MLLSRIIPRLDRNARLHILKHYLLAFDRRFLFCAHRPALLRKTGLTIHDIPNVGWLVRPAIINVLVPTDNKEFLFYHAARTKNSPLMKYLCDGQIPNMPWMIADVAIQNQAHECLRVLLRRVRFSFETQQSLLTYAIIYNNTYACGDILALGPYTRMHGIIRSVHAPIEHEAIVWCLKNKIFELTTSVLDGIKRHCSDESYKRCANVWKHYHSI